MSSPNVLHRVRSFIVLLAGCIAIAACSGARAAAVLPRAQAPSPAAQRLGGEPARRNFARAADAAVRTLEGRFYSAAGRWNVCVPNRCGTAGRDWGADSLLAALFVRWQVARDPSVPPIMNAFIAASRSYPVCRRMRCTMWSDVPMWDAVAAARAFEVTADPRALTQAQRAFAAVDRSDAFALGACPAIDFQKPGGGATALKTLETDANYIKAALLLRRLTGDPAYLAKARKKYAAIRTYFLDPNVPLYSVYVFDDGAVCRQLPKRFFASVNGTMIWNGLTLATLSGDARYRRDAVATAHAVAHYLSDPSGVFANLQADNDVAQPLIEAMYVLASTYRERFARQWIVAAAVAAQPARSGAYGRFFDGPAPVGPISAWAASGGLTLAIAAGALEPEHRAAANSWLNGHFVAAAIAAAPAAITFTGRAIALLGTIGDVCCEAGHIRVFIDGNETFDNTGIWQNKSPAARRLPDSVLLSWRWPRAGRHTIALLPANLNAKEGGSFVRLAGYEYVP